jgi:hypothetical protein
MFPIFIAAILSNINLYTVKYNNTNCSDIISVNTKNYLCDINSISSCCNAIIGENQTNNICLPYQNKSIIYYCVDDNYNLLIDVFAVIGLFLTFLIPIILCGVIIHYPCGIKIRRRFKYIQIEN